jgi:hypothetical protein
MVPFRGGPGRGVATLEVVLTGVDAKGVAISLAGRTMYDRAALGSSTLSEYGDSMPESLSHSDARGGVTVDVPDATELLDDSLRGRSL